MEFLTDEQLMQGLNQCDECGLIEKSEYLFWNMEWDEHTQNQFKALQKMQKLGYQAVCGDCFIKLVKKGD